MAAAGAATDYLSAVIKVGAIVALAVGVIFVRPTLEMPALTRFVDGNGPVFAGKIFPFCFITIACGAVSGFHALISSGTTPKMILREGHARIVGYGSMLMESFVGVIAIVAACALQPGVYFAINSPAGLVGNTADAAAKTIGSWGFALDPQTITSLAQRVGERTLLDRTGGAPSLAMGMAQIFSGTIGGEHLLAIWYHFAIMFEALFILTTLDAGTRVGRFMVHDLAGHVWKPLGRSGAVFGTLAASAVIVSAWGYFLWQGVMDPLGGINSLCAALRYRKPAACGGGVGCGDDDSFENGPRAAGLDNAHSDGVACGSHDDGQLSENIRRESAPRISGAGAGSGCPDFFRGNSGSTNRRYAPADFQQPAGRGGDGGACGDGSRARSGGDWRVD